MSVKEQSHGSVGAAVGFKVGTKALDEGLNVGLKVAVTVLELFVDFVDFDVFVLFADFVDLDVFVLFVLLVLKVFSELAVLPGIHSWHTVANKTRTSKILTCIVV